MVYATFQVDSYLQGYTVHRKANRVGHGNLLTDEVRQKWEPKCTLRKNFQAVGLAYDANKAMDKFLPVSDPYLSPDEAEVSEEDKTEITQMLHVCTFVYLSYIARCLRLLLQGKSLSDPGNNGTASDCMINTAQITMLWPETERTITTNILPNS